MSINQYSTRLALGAAGAQDADSWSVSLVGGGTQGGSETAPATGPAVSLPDPATLKAAVDVGSLLSLVDGIGQQDIQDIMYAMQLAQRGASGASDRHAPSRSWYQPYDEILEKISNSTQRLTFNTQLYARHRELMMRKLGGDSGRFLGALMLGNR